MLSSSSVESTSSVTDQPTGATDQPMIAGHWRDLYPFDSHYLEWATKSGERLRMHYLDEGPDQESGLVGSASSVAADAADQATFLFVHGNPTWSFYWRNLVLGIRAKHRCVAVDHIGCGLSDKPQHYNYTLAQHIDNLCRLVDTLDLKNITLVAHDWGGAIGLGTALARESRFARLVLLNTGAFPPPYIPWRIQACRWPWMGTLAIRGLNAFAGAALHMATELPNGLPPLVKAGLIAPYFDWTSRVAIDAFVKDIPSGPRHPTWKTLTTIESDLHSLADRPVQLIWGLKDWCFRPECLTRFQQIFPNAKTVALADAGHYVVEDAPDRVLGTIQEFEVATR